MSDRYEKQTKIQLKDDNAEPWDTFAMIAPYINDWLNEQKNKKAKREQAEEKDYLESLIKRYSFPRINQKK